MHFCCGKHARPTDILKVVLDVIQLDSGPTELAFTVMKGSCHVGFLPREYIAFDKNEVELFEDVQLRVLEVYTPEKQVTTCSKKM
jgi:hypothetical protein